MGGRGSALVLRGGEAGGGESGKEFLTLLLGRGNRRKKEGQGERTKTS